MIIHYGVFFPWFSEWYVFPLFMQGVCIFYHYQTMQRSVYFAMELWSWSIHSQFCFRYVLLPSHTDWESVPSPSAHCVSSQLFLYGIGLLIYPWLGYCMCKHPFGVLLCVYVSPVHARSLVPCPLWTVDCCHRFIVKLGLLIYPGLACYVYKNPFGVAAEFFWPC